MSDESLTFTGERLHDADPLFGVDLMRHQAAYHEAIRIAKANGFEEILELGSGAGYGARLLAGHCERVLAIDRVAPARSEHASNVRFIRGDLRALPLVGQKLDLVVSFQVIEHLEDPSEYLDALATSVSDTGLAMITTPNVRFSDGENPFHVHEYEAGELRRLLETRFHHVEMLGVSARGDAMRYHEERLARIRRIVALDPLGLRRRLPRAPIEWLFARFARIVRRSMAGRVGLPEVALTDFPIERAHERSLDLLALCRRPRDRMGARHSLSPP